MTASHPFVLLPAPNAPLLRRPRLNTPVTILLISLLLTATACFVVAVTLKARDRLRFENEVQAAQDRIEGRLETYVAMLRGTAGLFAANQGEVTRPEFAAYVGRLNVRERYAGIQGIGFSKRTPARDVPAGSDATGAQGPAGSRDGGSDHFPIVYLEPLDPRNQAALGFDMFSEPVRREAMERAWRSGLPALSGRVTLKQEIDARPQAGFLLYVPVFHEGQVPSSESDRLRTLEGFVYAPLRADDFFAGIFGREASPDVALRVHDGPVPSAENLLHDSTAGVSDAHAPEFTRTTTLVLAGRPWTVSFISLPSFERATPRSLVPGIALSGLVTSLVLFGLARSQATARRDAEQSAELLEAERARLSALFMAAPAAIALTRGPEHVYVLSNPINNAWIGHREVLGKPVREALPEAEPDGFLALLDRVYRTGEAFTANEMPLRPARPDGTVQELFINFVYQPTRDAKGCIDGIAGFAFDVTAQVLARRKIEALAEELQAGEARLRTLVEANVVGIIFWDLDGAVSGANDAFLQSIGYTRQDLEAGRIDWRQLTPREWHAQDEQLVKALLETGKHPPAEKEYFRKDGSRLPLIVASTFLPGSRREGIAFVLDISERKRAEQGLRESEARARAAATEAESQKALLDAVLDAAPVGIIVADANGKLLRMNPGNERLWGVAPYSESVARYGEWKAWWADGSERHGRPIQPHEWAMARALRGEVVRDDVLELEPFDSPGTRRTMLNSGAPVRDASGRIVGAVIAQMDITARVRAELASRESEERFRTLADNISQLAWMADETGSIVWYNRRWYEYTGTNLEQMKGWGWRSVYDPAELPRVEARFRRAIAAGEPWEDTFLLRRVDGQFRAHLSRAMPLRNEEGHIVRWFGTNTDIEDQQRQAAELRKAIETRDIFLSVASHELKTPLTSLALRLAQVRRAARGTAPGQQERSSEVRNLEVAEAQVRRLAVLVDGLLDVTRIGEGRLSLVLEDVDVAEVVRETAQAMAPQAERAGSSLDVEVPARAVGRFDRPRLGQVVTNLLSNAIKFGAGKPIRVALVTEDKTVRLTVADEGIGIDPDSLQRIFERFERGVSERHYGGLGLGLYITRKIAEAMGGTVKVESSPGRGATFTVELPIAAT
jgi:PAS domain S-box-containing protein